MSRPVVIYLGMIVVLVGGLWAVLAIGAHLPATEDLAGKWDLQPVGGGAEVKGVGIEQSGEFFQIAFDPSSLVDMKITQSSASRMLLENGNSKLEVTGTPGSDDKTFYMTGKRSGQWIAHRTVRTFPSDVSTKEGA